MESIEAATTAVLPIDQQIAAAQASLDQLKKVADELAILEKAENASSLAKCSFTDWSTGNNFLEPELLRAVIDLCIRQMMIKHRQQLRSGVSFYVSEKSE